METRPDEGSPIGHDGYLPRTPPRKTEVISKERVLLVAGGMGVVLVGLLFYSLSQRQEAQRHPPEEAPPAFAELAGEVDPAMRRRLKLSYVGVDRTVSPKEAPPKEAPPKEPPPQANGIPPMFNAEAKLKEDLDAAKDPPAQTKVPSQEPTPKPLPKTNGKSKSENRDGTPWLYGGAKLGKSPFEGGQQGRGREHAREAHAAEEAAALGLVKPVVWGKPVPSARILYRSQIIHGALMDNMNSDSPGEIRIKITRPVEDFHQTGDILIPQHCVMLTRYSGKPNFGANRFDMDGSVGQIICPDGTVMDFRKSQIGDITGTPGLAANVDNHYLALGFGVILTAALSVGARSVGGNGNGGYQADPALEFSRNVAGSVNQTGTEIIKRFQRPPTLTNKEEGEALTIRPTENVSLTKHPIPLR